MFRTRTFSDRLWPDALYLAWVRDTKSDLVEEGKHVISDSKVSECVTICFHVE